MKVAPLLLSLLLVSVRAHEYFPGQCPNFTPMAGFEWNKFATGVWFVTRKFATKSSCLTYEFKTDAEGFKSVEQVRQLPFSERVGLDHEYIYTGKLYAPQESTPAKMIVRFPLNVVGSSNYIVLDTDYDNYAMVCTCQDMDLFFTYAHRRSCSILQRSSTEDTSLTDSMSQLLDGEIEDASHDFDKIKQEGCEYDKEKVLNIDVDKILGLKGNSEVRDAVNEAASELEFDKKTIEEIRSSHIDHIDLIISAYLTSQPKT